MKKFLLSLLFITMCAHFSSGQIKSENFNSEIIFGFDMGFHKNSILESGGYAANLKIALKLGNDYNYNFSNKFFISSGLRFKIGEYYGETNRTLITNFFLEIPMRTGFFIYKNNTSTCFVEGGFDFNHSLTEIQNRRSSNRIVNANPEIRKNTFIPNLSIGWTGKQTHKENPPDIVFQFIAKRELNPQLLNSDISFIYLGLETGIRF